MQLLDWVILFVSIAGIVVYGAWKTKGSKNVEDYMLGNKQSKWWTIGISVMATQASAITFLSTPGQAFHDGMGFVQFYFGLPIAMIIISLVFIPIYHNLKVFTAYEFLEKRFDVKTRYLTAAIFLIQRGLAAGITIYAPAIILSSVLGWDLNLLNIIIGLLVIIYTVSGGTNAVNVTQKQQMFVILVGMFSVFFYILFHLPEGIGFNNALHVAGANQKLKIMDFSFDPSSRYTFWSGITGGLFLALSYFGTDQSQVQRYLSGKSIRESQLGLVFNGFFKIPMQFFILLCGVMVYVFFQFNSRPLHFNEPNLELLKQTEYYESYKEIDQRFQENQKEKQFVTEKYIEQLNVEFDNPVLKNRIVELQHREIALIEQSKDVIKKAKLESNDKDYVFIHFVLNYLPTGIIGLLIAVILSAAMSSTASELNALSTITTMDFYQKWQKTEISPEKLLKVSKAFTLLWGLLAIAFASFGTLFENLIQLVNIIGSIFYGTVLGIFLTAFFLKQVQGKAVFYAGLFTQVFVIFLYYFAIHIQPTGEELLGYLWLNLIGCGLTMLLSLALQKVLPNN